MTPNLGFKVMVLCKGEYYSKQCVLYSLTDNSVTEPVSLQCNVVLMCGSSVIAGLLVIFSVLCTLVFYCLLTPLQRAVLVDNYWLQIITNMEHFCS